MREEPFTLTAPAKVNLFLHVLGKNSDDYHLLQSLICFADFGDKITIEKNDSFDFQITNTPALKADDENLIVRTSKILAQATNNNLNIKITLTKHTPIGAGLGGGSADAAAVARRLLNYWGVFQPPQNLDTLLLSLGADVPICYYNQSALVENIGDKITPCSLPKNIPAVLIYPNKHCSTVDVFRDYSSKYSEKIAVPNTFKTHKSLYDFISTQKNDLTDAAIKNIPVIADVLNNLEQIKECNVIRMSGSGSCCFGFFDSFEYAQEAAQKIQKERPNWWVRPTLLNPDIN